MKIKFNKEKLEKLLTSFSILTGIRIVVFDEDFNEIVSSHLSDCQYCKAIQSCKEGLKECQKSNLNALKTCKSTDELYVYKCHSGLIEAMINLKVDNQIVGYIMFGQISDIKDKEQLKESLNQHLLKLNITQVDLEKIVPSIKYKSPEQIKASSTILLALNKYVVNEKMISIDKEKFIQDLDNFLLANLDDCSLDTYKIAHALNLSRTSLYQMCSLYLDTTLAKYVLLKRLAKAKELAKNTNLEIMDISSKVGYLDYNYFSRIFKKYYHKSLKKMREE